MRIAIRCFLNDTGSAEAAARTRVHHLVVKGWIDPALEPDERHAPAWPRAIRSARRCASSTSLQNASSITQERLSCVAQSHSARQPFEQEESHLPLEILDLARQRRLSDVKALCCSSEVLLFSNADETAQVPKLHLIPSRYWTDSNKS